MENLEKYILPDKWVWTKLMESCQYLSTGVEKYEGKIEYCSTGSIQDGCCIPEKSFSFLERPSRANRMAQQGDVLQARMASTNKALLIDEKLDGKLISTGFIQLRPFNCCKSMSSYIYYYIQSPDFFEQRDAFATGSTQVAITDNGARNLSFPLAPLPEQHRIVTKIEELFIQLDAGVDSLKKTQAQLKQYCQSVLKFACEGKLVPTEAELALVEEREYEPADVLLGRILKERRGKWEEEQKHKGKMSAKYKEPAAPVVSGLGELPEGWGWVNMTNIGIVSGGLTKNSKRQKYPHSMPYLRVANVYSNELRIDDIKYIGIKNDEINRVLLKDGDLLVVEGNGSLDQIGRVSLWNESIAPCVHQNHIIKVRFSPVEFGKYVLIWLLSINGRKQITTFANSTSGLYTLSISKVSALPIPLPPLAEQHRIVAEVERRLLVADEIKKTIDQSLKQAERLRQSILKKAFEGKLVPQDPDDELASVLLKKIKEEKVKLEIEEKNNKKMKSKIKKVNQMGNDGVDLKSTIGLHEILKVSKRSLTPKELWQSSKLEIDNFYAELKTEVERGRIIERRPDNSAVFLEVEK